LIEKYLDLLWDCDIYIIAIVMCPDRKTGWFKEHLKYSAAEIKRIKTIVVKAWKSKYAPQDQPESSQVQKKDKSRKGKLWATNPDQAQKKQGYDHIETYLSEPTPTKESITAAGGYLNYW
ncbi:hypothetical protein BYT27DRAFT_7016037, partial [Phlegmacium glaucopus]